MSSAPQMVGATDGPVAQSVRIGFRVLQLAMLLLAFGWAISNLRQVPPDTQAVVLRFGEVVRGQPAGLVLAWPRPIEEVRLVPGVDRQMELKVEAGTAGGGLVDPASAASGETAPASAGGYLTGDGGVVLLDASLTWRIADARTYVLAAPHVAAALRRLFVASALTVAAGRALDDFMVVRPERTTRDPGGNDPAAQAQRQVVRGDLAREINRRLAALEREGSGLGVEVTRVDVVALLPPASKIAFDAVLEAAQLADQGLATARTDATRTMQAADRERNRILTEAHASAAERVAGARSKVAPILALEERVDRAGRPNLLDQIYRERIAQVLRNAGAVTTVDGSGGSRLILPGGGS
jgi:modulator of FtsH protease HflK